MEELNKKVIWNAVSAYFLVLVSLTFLVSKQKHLNHDFVKSHVKSAFALHALIWIILFIMSYGFFESIHVLTYSLNTIITAILMLITFSGILYGMFKANKGQTVTIGEMFHHASSGKQYLTKNKSENIQEEQAIIMILAHIPFLGYIVGTRHKEIPHMRDVLQLNFLVTLLACALFIFGYTSLANIIMLVYIIWSVAQSISLATQWVIVTFGIDAIPTVEEKYILQKTVLRYVLNTFNRKVFVPFNTIHQQKKEQREKDEQESEKNMKSPYSFKIKNLVILIALFIGCSVYFGWDSRVLILFLFPFTYLFWHSDRKAYKMPYIYDIYALISWILYKISHIFSTAKKLKNTNIHEKIVIWEEQKK